jgi:hypothetical protein
MECPTLSPPVVLPCSHSHDEIRSEAIRQSSPRGDNMNQQVKRVLFLDFDGVLHPAQGNLVPEFAHAPRLAGILADTDCAVVISSTWRDHLSLEEIRALLPTNLRERVVGVLGPDQRGPHVRFKNIRVWLESQSEPVDAYVAIDDSASDFPSDCRHLILCDGRTGLGDEQERALREWLKG